MGFGGGGEAACCLLIVPVFGSCWNGLGWAGVVLCCACVVLELCVAVLCLCCDEQCCAAERYGNLQFGRDYFFKEHVNLKQKATVRRVTKTLEKSCVQQDSIS